MKRLSLLLLVMFSYADNITCPPPSENITEVIDAVRAALKLNCGHSTSAKETREVIRTTFMPHIDSSMLTKQVLGRKYWFDASVEDRGRLQELLEMLLIKQYAEAFNCKYLNSRVDVLNVRGDVERYMRVDSNVYLVGEAPISVKYAVRCDDSEWKIFDIVVDGLSVAQTYRSQFNRLLSNGGIEALNNYLSEKLESEDS